MGKEIEMFLLVFFLLLLILWNLFQIETYGVKFGISKYELNKCFNISRNDWNPCDWDPGIHELLLEPHASGYVKVCTMRGRGEIPLVQVSCHMRTAGTLCLLCPCRDPLIIIRALDLGERGSKNSWLVDESCFLLFTSMFLRSAYSLMVFDCALPPFKCVNNCSVCAAYTLYKHSETEDWWNQRPQALVSTYSQILLERNVWMEKHF